MEHVALFSHSTLVIESIVLVLVMYGLLITEKFNRVLIVGITAMCVILGQVLTQTDAFHFVGNNLGVLGFIIGMTIIVGIVRTSGVFDYVALTIVKKTQGHPLRLLASIAGLAWILTILLSNIPTVLILTPIVVILVKKFKLPALPYFLTMLTIANIAGATTPISDPTTYYQAQQVGLGFMEVVQNSGAIALVLCCVTLCYSIVCFRKQLLSSVRDTQAIHDLKPEQSLTNKNLIRVGIPLLALTILAFVVKDAVFLHYGFAYDNATIALLVALILIVYTGSKPDQILKNMIDRETIFFFMGLFIVIGGLEHMEVIAMVGTTLVSRAGGSMATLLFYVTMGSGVLSTFIDNVPYNITMVSAIKAMAASGISVYPLRWALNLGTSFGGAGSPIGAACSVVSLGEAEKEHIHFGFLDYMTYAFPLVIINGLITFGLLYLKFL